MMIFYKIIEKRQKGAYTAMKEYDNLIENPEECRVKETAELLLSKTPFYLETGWELVTENRNPACSHVQIEQMIQKRTINLIDMELLKILASFHYLNHYHIAYLLEERLHPNYHKSSYLNNLNKLKRAGIVLCHIPVAAGAVAGDVPPAPASPLRLYCLSQGAYTYMEPVTPDTHAMQPAGSLRKVEIAAANQFILHFLHYCKERVSSLEYLKNVRLGTSSFAIDGIIQYRTAFRKGEPPDLVSLFVLSIRKQEGWEKRAAMRLHLFKVWLARHGAQYRIPFPVLVVENLMMAVSLFAVLQAQENPLSVYFCPENLLMLYPPLSSIYRCEADEEGKVKAVRLAIGEDV